MVHVSIDGPDKEVHERARGKNTFAPTIRGAKLLTDAGVYVRVGTVIFKHNEGGLEEMINSVAKLGANEIIFSFMEPVGRLAKDSPLLSSKTPEEIKIELGLLSQKYSPQIKVSYNFDENRPHNGKGICPAALKKFLFIDNLGRVSPCSWVAEMLPQYRFNSLKNSSFREVMNSDQLKSYLDYVKSFGNCGKGCPVRLR
jgi:MoaA/NifB/PqqE/SkfB family radical SAM enzyme